MSSNICKRLLIQIFPKLVLCTCFFCPKLVSASNWSYDAWDCTHDSARKVNCAGCHYGVETSVSAGPYKNKTVFNINQQGDNDRIVLETSSIGACNSEYTFPLSNRRTWCRVCVNCGSDGVYLANKCGENDSQHAERVSCLNIANPFYVRDNTRSCKSFSFGPVIKVNGQIKANLQPMNVRVGNGVFSADGALPETYLWTDRVSGQQFRFDDSTKINGEDGQCIFQTSTDLDNPEYAACMFGLRYRNIDRNFKLVKNFSNNEVLRCQEGTVKWTANEFTAGDVMSGFYMVFEETQNNPVLSCTEGKCYTGWKRGSDGRCGECDTDKNFDSFGTDYCFCKYGYTYNSNTRRCEPYTAGNFVEVGESGEYRCNQGYERTEPRDSPNENSGYRRFECRCKQEFSNTGCTCPSGYTPYDRNNVDPEDDTCVVNSDATYYDSTGTFRLGTTYCDYDWWSQS